MPRERDAPYVAAGFRNDAQKLLERFVAKKSLKFADFAEIWRDSHFSTIYMGREGLRELTEFIEECYRNTLLFMDATDLYQKVGVVYLLYSLYLKQPPLILKSQIPIRVSYRQVVEMFNLENHFLEAAFDNNDVLDLTCIVTKLFKIEAFNITCFPIPMGPSVPIPLLKLEPLRNSSVKETLGAFRMLNENDIKAVGELSKIHEEMKQLTFFNGASEETTELSKFEEVKQMIEEFEDRYNAGLFPNEIRTLYPNQGQRLPGQNLSQEECNEAAKKASDDLKLRNEFRSLGQRRAFLKAQQFEMGTEFGKSRKRMRSSSDSSSSESSPPTPVKRGPGRPKKQKLGKRRRKKVVENVAETEFEAEATNTQTEAEAVDNPEMLRPVPYFPYRRPSKYPRPVRTLYFQNNEDKDEAC